MKWGVDTLLRTMQVFDGKIEVSVIAYSKIWIYVIFAIFSGVVSFCQPPVFCFHFPKGWFSNFASDIKQICTNQLIYVCPKISENHRFSGDFRENGS